MAPIEPEIVDETPAERQRKPFLPLPEAPDPIIALPGAEESQFSLRDMMILVTFASVLFAGMAQLPKSVFAGAAGLTTLVMLGVFSLVPPRHPLMRYGWWLLFATYLLAAMLATVGD
jgi:hypothetical protein